MGFWYPSHLWCVPFCPTTTLPTKSESWVLFVMWFKIFSGRSFHYMGIRKEESLVGGTVMWNNFKRTAALNRELNEQSLTPLMHQGWLAVLAASLSFASRRKISKCYTENRSWNKLACLKAHRDAKSWETGIRERKIHFNQTTAKKYNSSSFANHMKTIQKWHKNIYKFEKYLKKKKYRSHNIKTNDVCLKRKKKKDIE